jgi:hypothetical protein
VISLVALFVALGGTSYAVTALPRDSVGSKQLRARAVKESDLGNGSVITRKLAGQAVTGAKLARGAVTADRVAPDALGGPQIDESTLTRVPFAAEAARARTAERATLADRVEHADRADRATSAAAADRSAVADRAVAADSADHAGVADALSRVDVNQQEFDIADGAFDIVTVRCDEGLVPVSGGFTLDGGSDLPQLLASAPLPGRWRLDFFDPSEVDLYGPEPNGVKVQGTAYAICVKADGT